MYRHLILKYRTTLRKNLLYHQVQNGIGHRKKPYSNLQCGMALLENSNSACSQNCFNLQITKLEVQSGFEPKKLSKHSVTRTVFLEKFQLIYRKCTGHHNFTIALVHNSSVQKFHNIRSFHHQSEQALARDILRFQPSFWGTPTTGTTVSEKKKLECYIRSCYR